MTSSEFWWVKVKLQSIELESGKNLLLVANRILNEKLVSKLAALVDKLKATSGARVFKRGHERAVYIAIIVFFLWSIFERF